MVPVLTAEEMRGADRRAIEEIGLPGAVLMENAGAAVEGAVRQRLQAGSALIVLCGKGNNGGDGFVLARRLLDQRPIVLLLGRRAELGGDAALHAQAYERSGGRIREAANEAALAQAWSAGAGDLIVDAILGTGLREAPRGVAAAAIARVREARSFGARVVAVDIPSGIPSDATVPAWPFIESDATVTFAAPKWAHVLPPWCDAMGTLEIADIGIPRFALLETGTRLGLLQAADVASAFPARAPGAHKGDHGHVLVIAGSLGKTGAAVLSGCGALRAGAGLVTIATPASALAAVASGRAELMTEPLPSDQDTLGPESVERAFELASARDAVVLGPGLGQGAAVRHFVAGFLARYQGPLVVDADALNALAAGEALTGFARSAATVLTPHPGEMARLLGTSSAEIQAHRVDAARRLAEISRAIAILKGQRTLVAEWNAWTAVNPTGNPGLATAGSGDVLSGIVGALLARKQSAWLSATAGVFAHGLAGDQVAAEHGQETLMAGDVAEGLGRAIQLLQAGA